MMIYVLLLNDTVYFASTKTGLYSMVCNDLKSNDFMYCFGSHYCSLFSFWLKSIEGLDTPLGGKALGPQ